MSNTMLRGVKELRGYALCARDGEIGHVDEVLFDDDHWTVRYLVVDTGGWLTGRKVLIPPAALGALDWSQRVLNVSLTRDQVERSPAAETDKPVSRQWETDYYDYYEWPYYWGSTGMVAAAWYSGTGMDPADPEAARDHQDAHLRSSQEVTGYGITAQDGHLGHVEDFIVDAQTWRIRYLAVDTRDWWPGKKVLLPTDWIEQTNWPEQTVTVGVTRDQVRNGPEWDTRAPISSAFEAELFAYYAYQRVVTAEIPVERMEAFAERAGHR